MTNDAAAAILSALDIALFERRADGSFASLGALPEWFAHLAKDQTFPFLGTFLDEARTHWEKDAAGRLRSGLCTEVDDQGFEFQFEVSAIAGPGGQFLVFERPAGADHLHAVLQRVREQALDREARARSHTRLQAALTTLELQAQEARRVARSLASRTEAPRDAETLRQSQQPTIEPNATADRLASLLDAVVETSRLVAREFQQG